MSVCMVFGRTTHFGVVDGELLRSFSALDSGCVYDAIRNIMNYVFNCVWLRHSLVLCVGGLLVRSYALACLNVLWLRDVVDNGHIGTSEGTLWIPVSNFGIWSAQV